jgi:hypothetical protein
MIVSAPIHPRREPETALRHQPTLLAASALGVLALVSPAVAHAEAVPVPDVVRSTDTVDGWHMTLALTDARIDKVPDMAAAPLSSQGFLSGRVTVTVEGEGASAVNEGQLVLGAQVACQLNLDDGLDLGADLDADLFDDLPIIGVNPDIGVNLRSGALKTVGLGNKALKGRFATITVADAHVQVDECGGAVSVRLFASARISTDTSDDSLNVYSEVLPL